jgi:ATP-dependent Clp protease ATP-binding subunit ClpA
MTEAAFHPLDEFCDNLRLRARRGQFSRHPEYIAEITRAFEILARRYESGRHQRWKCNPVFLDSDGKERQVVLAGVMAVLAAQETPAVLRGWVILSLNYEALMEGVDPTALAQRGQEISATYSRVERPEDVDRFTGSVGVFQQQMRDWADWEQSNVAYQRLRAVLVALQAMKEPTILLIDHLHRILGGDWQHYPVDMAPVLKPLLNRREIHLWGACTLADYPIIERDASMQRCFRHVCLPSARTLLK